MPGVLIMDQDGADRDRRIKNGSSDSVSMLKGEEGKPLTNGVKTLPQLDGVAEIVDWNGAPRPASINGISSEFAGQVMIPDSLVESWSQLPPELQHFEESYLPLSTLIERVAQQCYTGLDDTIQKMAERPRDEGQQPNTPVVNGIGHYSATNGATQISKEDLRKRTLLMIFARDQRDKLIKLMVLTQWSRQVGDVSKLIDIWNWLSNQMRTQEEAANWIGQVKINMIPMKQNNPDIRTALEVLTSGKASWMPDMAYLPPKPLSAEQQLKTLRNLNTILTIRLNYYENQPKHFKYSSIANGRATWTVPGEFEVDLSIADEDPESKFFFIDLRLLYSPAQEIPDVLQGPLESRVNDALRTHGLDGCYDVLHDLVLTHKIQVLMQQAQELSRRKWSENLQIELLHRNLTVQYWTELPGPKSWIVFGVESGRKSPGQPGWQDKPISRVIMRWFRDGNEVTDIDLMRAVNLTELSMEQNLETVVKLHALDLLRRIGNGLNSEDGGTSPPIGSLMRPKTPSQSPTYEVQLGASGTVFTLLVELVTGNLAIRPVTLYSVRIGQEINQLENRPLNATHGIRTLLFSDLQRRVEKLVERKGWSTVKNLNLTRDSVKAAFNQDVGRLSIFRPAGWSQDWTLVTTITLSADAWWIAKIDNASTGRTITEADRIISQSTEPLTLESLSHMERYAVTTISFRITRHELKCLKIEDDLDVEPPSAASPSPFPHIRLRILLCDLGMHLERQRWTDPSLYLTQVGQDRPEERVVLSIKGRIQPHLHKRDTIHKELAAQKELAAHRELASLLTRTNDHEVVFHKSGAFSLLLRSAFGESLLNELKKRIYSVERLCTVVEHLRKWGFGCERLSLASVTFTYPSSATDRNAPPLRARVDFTETENMDLTIDNANPHRRLLAWLRRMLTSWIPPPSFEKLTLALAFTLPILNAFNAIERNWGDDDGRDEDGNLYPRPPFVHPREPYYYRIRYERPRIWFDIKLKDRRSDFWWYVYEEVPLDETRSEHGAALKEGLRSLFTTPRPTEGDDVADVEGQNLEKTNLTEKAWRNRSWGGLDRGLACSLVGVGEALMKLDEVVRGSVRLDSHGKASGTGTAASASTGAGAQVEGRGAPGTSKVKQEKKNDVIELD